MDDINALLIRKGDDGEVVNTFTEWGIVCAKVPFDLGGTTKELPTRSWNDEHGEDVYIPSRLCMEAYDTEFEFAYKGEELVMNIMNLSQAFTQIDAFRKWLTGNDGQPGEGTGASLVIYSPFSTIGRKCYLKKFSDEDPCVIAKGRGTNLYNENVVTFKATFRVTDPMTNEVLSSS